MVHIVLLSLAVNQSQVGIIKQSVIAIKGILCKA